jgi:beta-hydroxylase
MGWIHTLTKDLGFPLLQRIERLVGQRSLVGNRPFFEPEQFDWVPRLEAGYPQIRAELDHVLAHREALPSLQDISPDQAVLSQDARWKTFFLYGFGHKAEGNCARCPATTRLVEAVPGMKTAFFSILAPGKHIPAHRGPYKGVLRCHLGLKIPSDADRCRIRVDNQVRQWKQGRILIFDDTYDHEVWNDTGEERVVLFMDVERPLPEPMASINRAIIWLVGQTSFVQQAKRNQEAWEHRMAGALPTGPF